MGIGGLRVRACLCIGLAAILLASGTAPALAETPMLNGHLVVLDDSGQLLAWKQPQMDAYAQIVRLAVDRLLATPVQPDGLRTFITYPTFHPGDFSGDPYIGQPAEVFSQLTDLALRYWLYSGDRRLVDIARQVLEYDLANGLTPADWPWGSFPYASSEAGATTFAGRDDAPCGGCGAGDGLHVVEPDKGGELGLALFRLGRALNDQALVGEAIHIADVLASTIRPGTATESPWPFRINAQTGTVRDAYSADVILPVELFDALTQVGLGQLDAYRTARTTAMRWLFAFPMRNQLWSGFYEDVPSTEDLADNVDQFIPIAVAQYLVLNRSADPNWRSDARALIDWVATTFGVDYQGQAGRPWGAVAISEQSIDMYKMASDTARFGAVSALYYASTGDESIRDRGFRSLNWATYMCDESGLVTTSPGYPQYWFSDGYTDYIPYFLRAMAAVPQWAPPGEAHILSSTSEPASVVYSSREISYRTVDSDSSEALLLPSPPTRIVSGGKAISARHIEKLSDGSYEVSIEHARPDVELTWSTPPAAFLDGGGQLSVFGLVAFSVLAATWIGLVRRRRRRRPSS